MAALVPLTLRNWRKLCRPRTIEIQNTYISHSGKSRSGAETSGFGSDRYSRRSDDHYTLARGSMVGRLFCQATFLFLPWIPKHCFHLVDEFVGLGYGWRGFEKDNLDPGARHAES